MWSLFLPFLTVFLLVFIYLQYFSAYFKEGEDVEPDEVFVNHFPINIEFEILPYKGTIKYLSSEERLKVNEYFDSQIYISSDYISVVKALKRSPEAQSIILKIINNKIVKSIVVENNQIKIIFKMVSMINLVPSIYHAKNEYIGDIQFLKEKFLPILQESYKTEIQEDINFAKNKSKKYRKLYKIYLSFYPASFIQILYSIATNEDIYLLNQISIFFIFIISLVIFIPFTFYILKQTSGSLRINKIFKHHLLLLLAIQIVSLNFIYTANYSMDTSKNESIIASHQVYVGSGKGRGTFYYYPTQLEHLKFDEDLKVRIGLNNYLQLMNTKKSEVTIKKGWLGYPYITQIKPMKDET